MADAPYKATLTWVKEEVSHEIVIRAGDDHELTTGVNEILVMIHPLTPHIILERDGEITTLPTRGEGEDGFIYRGVPEREGL